MKGEKNHILPVVTQNNGGKQLDILFTCVPNAFPCGVTIM